MAKGNTVTIETPLQAVVEDITKFPDRVNSVRVTASMAPWVHIDYVTSTKNAPRVGDRILVTVASTSYVAEAL